jgi:hypothetical protein
MDSDPYIETIANLCESEGAREAMRFVLTNGLDPTNYRNVWMNRASALYQEGRRQDLEQLLLAVGSVDDHLAVNLLYGLVDVMNNRENRTHYRNLLALCKHLQTEQPTGDATGVLEMLINKLEEQSRKDEEHVLELKAKNLYRPLGRG